MRKIISILVPLLFSIAAQATPMTSGSSSNNYYSSNVSIGNVQKNNDVLFIYSSYGKSESQVSSYADLNNNDFNSISTGTVKSGSAYQNTVAVETGSVFSFDWLWFSTEYSNSIYNDFAFVNLSLGGLNLIADTSTTDYTTGNFSWTADQSGLLTYTIGALNVNDNNKYSKLLVNNIAVTEAVSIPGPASLGIFAVALVGFVISRRKTKMS